MLRGQNLCDRDPRAIGERPLGGQEWIERLAPGYFTNMWPENTSRTCVPFSFRSLSLFLFLVRFDIIPLSTARCPGAFTRVNFVHFVSRCWISRTVLVALCLSLSLSLSLSPFPFLSLYIRRFFCLVFKCSSPPPSVRQLLYLLRKERLECSVWQLSRLLFASFLCVSDFPYQCF